MFRFLEKLFRRECSEPESLLSLDQRANWERHQVLATVDALSLPGLQQLELIGRPIPGDEMIMDFWSTYTNRRDELRQRGVFDDRSTKALDELGTTLVNFQKRHNDIDYLLYCPSALTDDPRWNEIREVASHCLACCDFDGDAYETEITVTRYTDMVTHQWELKPKEQPPG